MHSPSEGPVPIPMAGRREEGAASSPAQLVLEVFRRSKATHGIGTPDPNPPTPDI